MQFAMIKLKSSIKRTASCTSAGSITIEAALSIPVFLFAVLCLVYILEIHAIQTTIQMAAHTAAKEVAQQMAVLPEIETGLFHSNLIRAAEADRLNRSIVVNGSRGIHCWKTQVNSLNQLEVCVEYKIRLPFPDFLNLAVDCQETFLVKCWTGYQKGTDENGADNSEIVYVTEYGSVYHKDLDCAYLNPAIQFISESMLGQARNRDGSRYAACEECTTGGSAGGCYITDYGEKYHHSLNCNGLKRTIYRVPMDDVCEKGGCSKCVK